MAAYASSPTSLNATSMASMEQNGPRAKCDQVIFEAIAKAAEIVVNGRTRSGYNQHYNVSGGMAFGAGGIISNTNVGSSSARFNLMVPELANVRQILQRWKRALHVPLRLDLFYQNPETNQNELVERWCLEYSPLTISSGTAASEFRSTDPIVQLRHVCKKIVIWLRNLYCASRLLPAQALQHPSCGAMGMHLQFSIYVLASSDTNDLADLVHHLNFKSLRQPSTVVTPYGELIWSVYHSSKACIERYLPPSHPLKAPLWKQSSATSMPRPILRNTTAPMAIPRNTSASGIDGMGHQQQQQQPFQHQQQQQYQGHLVPQSAPAGGTNYLDSNNQLYHHMPNNHNYDVSHVPLNHNQFQQPPNNTYAHPRQNLHLFHRSNSQEDANAHHSNHGANANQGTLLQRRNTSIGIPENSHAERQQQQQSDPIMEPPVRLMSGLSLALMTDNDNKANHAEANEKKNGDAMTDTAQVEKRRAALHHAPPHLSNPPALQQQQQPTATSAGEYGYAYNNHISWQQIRPAATVPIALPSDHQDYDVNTSTDDGATARNSYSPTRARLGSSPGAARLGVSPSPLIAGTPPSGAFFRTATGTTPVRSGSLLPPRSLASPPFPSRPLGFSQEPPPPPSPLVEPSNKILSHAQPPSVHLESLGPPMTSLDLLHSSPFQQGASMLSVAAVGGGASQGSLFRAPPSFWGSTLSSHPQSSFLSPSTTNLVDNTGGGVEDDFLFQDMPFAVEDLLVTSTAGSTAAPLDPAFADSALGASSSAAVATFAQKCAPAQHRLKLFESSTASTNGVTGTDVAMSNSAYSNLTSQLAEYRSFGASLTLPAKGGGTFGSGSDEGSSTTVTTATPMPLRTS